MQDDEPSRPERRLWRPDIGRDIDDELAFHLEERARDFRERGLEARQAQEAARQRFGDVARVRADCRLIDVRSARRTRRGRMLEDLRLDVTYAVRTLRRAPGFALGALCTFAIGLGLNLAVFAITDRILFRPLPYGHPDELVTIHSVDQRTGQTYFTLPRAPIAGARRSASSISDLAYAGRVRSYSADAADPTPIRLVDASFNLLDVLEVRPIDGRTFLREEALAGARVALLREETWRTRYGAGNVVGLRIADRRGGIEIVGILPAGFIIPTVNWATPADGLFLAGDVLDQASAQNALPGVVARLRRPATESLLQQQIDVIRARLGRSGSISGESHFLVEPIRQGLFWNCRVPVSILFAAGLCVWLMACVNLGTLILARARGREQQLAIRMSLGAGLPRMMRLAVIEALLLGAGGGALAFVTMLLGLEALAAAVTSFIQPLVLTSIDLRLAALAFASMMLGGLIAAVSPAWRIRRVDPAFILQRTGATSHVPTRAGRGLLVAESAIAAVLVIAGGLTTRSLVQLMNTSLGFEPDGLLIVQPSGGRVNWYDQVEGIRRTTDILRAIPAVMAVAAVDSAVASGEAPRVVRDERGRQLLRRGITPEYFEVMGTRMVAGRPLTIDELATSAPVAIATESTARLLEPGLAPSDIVGREVRIPGEPAHRIVGIAADTRERHGVAPSPELFVPLAGGDSPPALLIRVAGRDDAATDAASAVAAALRRELRLSAPPRVMTMSSRLEPWLRDPKLYARLFGVFGIVGLVLSATALFALTRIEASLRRHEIGVRLALGATGGQIRRLLLKQAVLPVAIGLVLGAGASLIAAPAIQSLLNGVDARGAGNYTAAAVCFLSVAFLSAWLAARQSIRADPVTVLRNL
jgi:predicted permease